MELEGGLPSDFGPANASIPCSGILREYSAINRKPESERGDTNWAWEMPDTIISSVLDSIHEAEMTGKKGASLEAYEKAMRVVWCDTKECVDKL